MNLIDERGRLLGHVNIYDAAVVVLVVLAIAGGAVVVLDPSASEDDSDEPVTRYVTVDLGRHSPAMAARIADGDTDGGLTVTDTYVGPAAGENVSVLARVRVNGTRTGDGIAYDGRTIAPGANMNIETAGYEVAGEVVTLDAESERVATETTSVVVETELPSTAAPSVERNDTYRIDGRTVGTVTGTAVEPATSGGNRSALVGLSLLTVSYDGRTYFGEQRLLVGRTVGFRTDRAVLDGRVVQLGNASLSESVRHRNVTVELHGVDADVADGFEVGLVERSGGRTVARVTGVATEPTPVTVIDGNGTVAEGDHPRNVDVTLTVELRVRETGDGLRFRTRPLREGAPVSFDFGSIVANGTVTDIGG